MSLSNFVCLFILFSFSSAVGVLVKFCLLAALLHEGYQVYSQNFQYSRVETNKQRDAVVILASDSCLGYAAANKLSEDFHIIAVVEDDNSAAAVTLAEQGMKIMKLELTTLLGLERGVKHILEYIEKKNLRLHGLLNASEINFPGELDWLEVEHLKSIIKVNLLSPVLLMKLLVSHFIKNKTRIVNIVGQSNGLPSYALAAHNASKFGLERFSESFRLEMSKFGVEVINVRPANYSRLAGIAIDQEDHLNIIWTTMNEMKRKQYSKEFYALSKSLVSGYSNPFFDNDFDGICSTLQDALLNKNPKQLYDDRGTSQKLSACLFAVLPSCVFEKFEKFQRERSMRPYLY